MFYAPGDVAALDFRHSYGSKQRSSSSRAAARLLPDNQEHTYTTNTTLVSGAAANRTASHLDAACASLSKGKNGRTALQASYASAKGEEQADVHQLWRLTSEVAIKPEIATMQH